MVLCLGLLLLGTCKLIWKEVPLHIQDLWVVLRRATYDTDDAYGVGLEDLDRVSELSVAPLLTFGTNHSHLLHDPSRILYLLYPGT